MKKIKKLLSILVVVCLLLCSFSVATSAALGDNNYEETATNEWANNTLENPTVLYKDFTIFATMESGDEPWDFFSFELFETSTVQVSCYSEFETLIGGIFEANSEELICVLDNSVDSENNVFIDEAYVTLPAGKYFIFMCDQHSDYNYYEYKYILYFDYQEVEAELIYEDGTWYCLIDGEYTDFTGLITIEGKKHYIRDGIWTGATGIVTINGKKHFINKGYFTGASGIVTLSGRKYYINKGYWTGASGIVTIGSKKYYINKGYWTGASGIVTIGSKKYYINKGYWSGASGLVTISGKKAYINKGYFTGATGIVKINGKRYYIKNGYAQLSYSGKVKLSGKTYTIKKGIVK